MTAPTPASTAWRDVALSGRRLRWFGVGMAVGLAGTLLLWFTAVAPRLSRAYFRARHDLAAVNLLADRLGRFIAGAAPTAPSSHAPASTAEAQTAGDATDPLGPMPLEPAAGDGPPQEPAAPPQPQLPPPPEIEEPSHPILHTWAKEGYNVWNELQTVLHQEAWGDAAQLIFGAATGTDRGLIAHPDDPHLLVSYETMLRRLMRDFPQVRQRLRADYGERASLRLGAAMAAGDAAAIRTVAEQLWGTGAAVEASRWLGDRALARGCFDEAVQRYRIALEGADPSVRPVLRARVRLARAMTGRAGGEPVAVEVEIGAAQLSATRFERLLEEIASCRSGLDLDATPGGLAAPHVAPAPPPGRYEARVLSGVTFQAHNGSASREGYLRVATEGPCPGITIEGNRLLASDGWLLAAMGAESGERLWQAHLGERRRSGTRGLPAVPAARGERAFVRHASTQGLVLRCHGMARGTTQWVSPSELYVLSDPLLHGDRLMALVLAPHDGAGRAKAARPTRLPARRTTHKEVTLWQLRAVQFDVESGEALAQVPLVELDEGGKYATAYRATASGGTIAASVPGGVLCADTDGRVRWVRRLPWADEAVYRTAAAPLVAGDRVFAPVPGAELIVALEAASGARRWDARAGGLVRLIGLAAGRLVAEDRSGLLALDPADGRVLWRLPVEGSLQGVACGGPGGLAYTRMKRLGGKKSWCPEIVWLDPASGQEIASSPLEAMTFERRLVHDCAPGPMLAAGGRTYLAHRAPLPGNKDKLLFQLVLIDQP